MFIKEIFESPIDRAINPAVVVGDEDSSTVAAEIKEYVFTKEIAENLYKLLGAIAEKSTGKTGIWINGYYGSGKSHFLKFAHYCMAPAYSNEAFDHFEKEVAKLDLSFSDATSSNVRALRKKLAAEDIENILFNVEAVSGDGKTERLTRIFLNQLNKHRGYNATDIPLARLLEKELDKAGQFEEFKTRLKAKNFDWEGQSTTIARMYIDDALAVAAELLPGLSTDVLRTTLKNPETYQVSINDTLIPELKEYIGSKGAGYRLVFLVDEISQYIGRNKDILLNLQTIVEAVGERLGHKVWIACTAQQNIEDVVEGMDSPDRKDEFGKILGRFDTRINLESNDPAFITKKRVLEKNSDGERELGKLYKAHKDAIDHQFRLGSDLYKGFSSDEDFTQSYPFVPYQFKLIADVFHSFQQLRYVVTEVKDNARSVIGITHYTIKQFADRAIGGFIPFDAFYNGLLETNLQHAGSRAIGRALGQEAVKADPFAQRVAKALFMVAHLSDEVQRIIAPTLDVLTVLLMERIDENKLELRQKISDVLVKLREANVIREEEGKFFFYNEDEVAVTTIITNQYVGPDERLKVLYEDFFSKLLKTVPNKVRVEQTDFAIAFTIDDKRFSNGDVLVNLSAFDKKPFAERALNTSADELIIGVSETLMKDAQLAEDLTWYFRVESYLGHNSSTSSGERTRTNQRFRERNDDLAISIRKRLTDCLMAAPCISGQRVLEPIAFTGTEPHKRYGSMLEIHIAGINKYLKLATTYPANEDELRAEAKSTQTIAVKELTEAERMVNDAISRNGDRQNVELLIQEFTRKPFSWRFTQVLGILLALQKKGVREFEYNNEPRYPNSEFMEKAIKTPNRSSCIVKSSEAISVAEVEEAQAAFNHIFNTTLPHTTDAVALFDRIKAELKKSIEACKVLQDEHAAAPFATHFRSYAEKLVAWNALREPKALLTAITGERDTARSLHDGYTDLKAFLDRFGKDYAAITAFVAANAGNFETLAPDAADKATRIREYLTSDKPQDEYRHIKKAMDELKAELAERLKMLQAEATAQYSDIFSSLRKEAEKAGVNDKTVLPEESHLLQRIEKTASIPDVALMLARAKDFRSEYITKIYALKDEQDAAKATAKGSAAPEVKEAVSIYISSIAHTVGNEQELEEFLATLKMKMLEMLHKKQTIIIRE